MVAELKRISRSHDTVVKVVAYADAPYDDVAIVFSVVEKKPD